MKVVNPIPRFAWTNKPRQDAGLLLAEMQGQTVNGEPKLTIAPGLIGEMYWNFGLPGIAVISLIIGVCIRRWDESGQATSDDRLSFLIYVSGLGIIFVNGRSLNAAHFYSLLALFGMMRVMRRFSSEASVLGASG